jgi:hypothetical protein
MKINVDINIVASTLDRCMCMEYLSKRVESYNQIKLCMCMEYGGYMIGVYGG